MDSTAYITLTRQSGLMREMELVAHNIANLSTAGYRREGVVFAEHVAAAGQAPSVSMGMAKARLVDLTQGALSASGGTYDLAIMGEGFFLIDTPEGQRLTRAGSFTPSADGTLVTAEGYPVLDSGGAPVVTPPAAQSVKIGPDGTISADGRVVGQIGLWLPQDPLSLRHQAGTMFSADAPIPAPAASMVQGMIEESNVNPITEVARMIEVQRAYEAGQSFIQREDDRARSVIDILGRPA
jgi:flagellar basal-body rod protein FlgF